MYMYNLSKKIQAIKRKSSYLCFILYLLNTVALLQKWAVYLTISCFIKVFSRKERLRMADFKTISPVVLLLKILKTKHLNLCTYFDIIVYGYVVKTKMSRPYTHCPKIYIVKIQQHLLFRSIHSRNYRDLHLSPNQCR